MIQIKCVRLRDATLQDYQLIKNWIEDPEINQFFNSKLRNISRYPKMYYESALNNRANYYKIILYDNIEVGLIAFIDIDKIDAYAQIWYLLGNKKYSGLGIMSQALNLIIKEAVVTLNLHSIHTWVVENNLASVRVLLKNSFSQIGIMQESFIANGQYYHRLLFQRILKEDYGS